jgi:hypothetical protein
MSTLGLVPRWFLSFFLSLSLLRTAICQTGYNYELDTEYSGADFFNGWEFFTV